MNKSKIEEIFSEYKLGEVKEVQKIEVGFNNQVFLVNGEFILKVCEDCENENNFRREIYLYNFFKDKLPVPRIKFFDDSKKIYNKFFMVYPKIEGENLYSKWHLMRGEERKDMIGQIVEILRVINGANFQEFAEKFGIDVFLNWQEKIVRKIGESLEEVRNKELLENEVIQAVEDFVEKNKNVLAKQKMALVYWDVHFDNILVKNNKIVGILDFEGVTFASIDYVLDLVKRMMDYPKKYMSKDSEKFARKEDYAQLFEWYQEFYPELFDFDNLEKRVALYSLRHDLKTLLWYWDSKETREMIKKTV